MTPTKVETMKFALKPDAQAFDEIRLKIIPRFKESELSGDEWRISTLFEFYRNGKVVHTDQSGGNIETACGLLFAKFTEAINNAHGFFASDGEHCDQEGCSNLGKFIFRIKQDYCAGGGNCGQKKETYTNYHRIFCEKHRHRGDSSLDDRDSNYELVETLKQ